MVRFPLFTILFLLALPLDAQKGGVIGDWREPGGSVLRVFACGEEVCMRIMTLRPDTPKFDGRDPDPAKRTQPLCGLQIGYGFQPQGQTKAIAGRVYDPESGRTYRGEMHTEGDVLRLRGYILIPALGRSETWKQVPPLAEACHLR